MNEEILKIVFGELKKSGVKPIDYDYNVDKFVSDPVEVMNSPFLRGDEIPSFWDFSEHDKPFEDKIASLENQIAYMKEKKSFLRTRCMEDAIDAFDRGSYGALTIVGRRGRLEAENKELKQRIAELESKETVDLPFDPLETANYLINATYERETSSLERAFAKVPDKVNDDRYTVDELEQIAEHLLVYCKYNKECEE